MTINYKVASKIVSVFLLSMFLPVIAWSADKALTDATTELHETTKLVQKRIITVSDNIYTAVGYTVSANSMIIGEDGIIVVDPGHAPPLTASVRKAFEEITNKPIKAIIFTHGHGDHTGGARAFIDEGAKIQVWARENYGAEMRQAAETGLRGNFRPADTQGGDLADEDIFFANGPIRPMSRAQRAALAGGGNRPQPIKPTHTFSTERHAMTIAGVTLELVAAPGETADQLYVWVPEQKVLFAGDNVFHTWPNVYPLRGSNRYIRDWANSIDKMIREEPEIVVAGHGNPIFDNAVEQLGNRRDAMRYVYDKTIEGIKKMMTPDELVEYAALPEKYATLDYLKPYYGSVEGTIRQIYAQNVGWFDGDPLNLYRDTPIGQSERMARLLGGTEAMLNKAEQSLQEGDALAAAQLAQHYLRLDSDSDKAKLLFADALRALAMESLNRPMRYYALSYSNKLRREVNPENQFPRL